MGRGGGRLAIDIVPELGVREWADEARAHVGRVVLYNGERAIEPVGARAIDPRELGDHGAPRVAKQELAAPGAARPEALHVLVVAIAGVGLDLLGSLFKDDPPWVQYTMEIMTGAVPMTSQRNADYVVAWLCDCHYPRSKVWVIKMCPHCKPMALCLPDDPYLQYASVEGCSRGQPRGCKVPGVRRPDGTLRGGAPVRPTDELTVLKPRPAARELLRVRTPWRAKE